HPLSHAPVTPYARTLSLHDALPIWLARPARQLVVEQEQVERAERGDDREHPVGDRNALRRPRDDGGVRAERERETGGGEDQPLLDRKSTRLNSSHVKNSYAVFCLKK